MSTLFLSGIIEGMKMSQNKEIQQQQVSSRSPNAKTAIFSNERSDLCHSLILTKDLRAVLSSFSLDGGSHEIVCLGSADFFHE